MFPFIYVVEIAESVGNVISANSANSGYDWC